MNRDKKEVAYFQIDVQLLDKKIWYHKGRLKRQMKNSEITVYLKISQDMRSEMNFNG